MDRAYLRARHENAGGVQIRRDAIVAVIGAIVGAFAPERFTQVHPLAFAAFSAVMAVVLLESVAYVWRFVWIAPQRMHFKALEEISRIERERDEAKRQCEALRLPAAKPTGLKFDLTVDAGGFYVVNPIEAYRRNRHCPGSGSSFMR